jgi:hypothetical protein
VVNIPGIIGFSVPGAFTIVRSRQGAVTLPGGPTILAIMGQGQREITLVESANGSGQDGSPAQFDPRLEPDGRHFLLTRAPVVPGSVQLFLNPRFDGTDVPLIEITDPAEGAAWAAEFGINKVTQIDQINGDTAGPPPTELDMLTPFGDTAGTTAFVQGFRPDVSGRFAKLSVWIEKVGTPLDDVIVKIYPSAGDSLPQGVGTELATATIPNSAIPAAGGATFVDLVFGSLTAELTEGELYYLRFERSSGTPSLTDHFALGINTSNSYGQAFESVRLGDVTLWPTTTEAASGAWDLIFRTFMNFNAAGLDFDLYGIPPGAGTIDEEDFGLDAYQGVSYGSGFFDTEHGRRYSIVSTTGEAERQHYYVDYATGQIILDHALNQGDKLLAVFLPENDLNEFELFFDLEALFAKHGFPSIDNTISQAAFMASLNNAPVIGAIHAGTKKDEATGRFLTDIFWSDAFEALEKEDIDFVVPVAKRDVVGEVIMPKYDPAVHDALTGGGTFLQEVPGGGDEPGLNITPLACDESGDPIRLEVFKNGRELVRGVDYTLDFVCQGSAEPTKILLTQPLVAGDFVTANYRPDIDLCASVQTVGLQHVEFMSSVRQRRERILWTGACGDTGFDEVLDPQTGVANTFGKSFRVVYMFPHRIRTVIGGETVFLDGQFLAAAAAGFLAAESYIPTPLTRKTLVGFDIEKTELFSIDQLNLLGDDGLTVVEPLSSGGRVVYGITTVQSGNPVEEEISIVRIRDFVAKTTREVLENRFVGGLIEDQTVANIKATTRGILESLVAQRIITEFANITSRVDPIEPRQVNVGFDISPVFPLNWIKIEFSIGVL